MCRSVVSSSASCACVPSATRAAASWCRDRLVLRNREQREGGCGGECLQRGRADGAGGDGRERENSCMMIDLCTDLQKQSRACGAA